MQNTKVVDMQTKDFLEVLVQNHMHGKRAQIEKSQSYHTNFLLGEGGSNLLQYKCPNIIHIHYQPA